jgi:quinol monooxygenase YgiN
MVVYYCFFRVDRAYDRAAFDAWFTERVQVCRRGPGCLVYEYSVSPERPDGGILFGAFDTKENFDRHRTSPNHIEMRTFAEDHGLRDRLVDYFVDGVHQPTHSPQPPDEVMELVRRRRLATAGAEQP